MGFWPFGRDPANVELVSRVVSAATQNGYRVRGKLTLHFAEPQRQADADLAADRCSAIALAMLRAAPDHGAVIGAEIQLSVELTTRYPSDVARARAVELAALHVVGDPALSDELRRAHGGPPSSAAAVSVGPASALPASVPVPSSGAPPVSLPAPSSSVMSTPVPSVASVSPASLGRGAPLSTPPPRSLGAPRSIPIPSSSAPRHSSSRPPPAPGGGTPAPGTVRRRGASQIRSVSSLLLPPGTPPGGMAQFITPLVKDSSARLLIGFLRAHDLSVRQVTLDENSGEMLANLVPVSDAPPGGYEASRAEEIERWQARLGQGPMFALHREVRVMCLYLVKGSLLRVEVMAALADAVIEALSTTAFADEAGLLAALARFAAPADFVATMAQDLTRLAGAGDDPAGIASALAPLVATVCDDLDASALIIKQASG